MYPRRWYRMDVIMNRLYKSMYRSHYYHCRTVTSSTTRCTGSSTDSLHNQRVKDSRYTHQYIFQNMTTKVPDQYHMAIKKKKHYFTTYTTDTTISGRIDTNSNELNHQYPYQVLLQHLTHSTRSLGVWEGIESIYNNTTTTTTTTTAAASQNLWESIRELPEIETVRHALQIIQQQIDPSFASSPSSMMMLQTQQQYQIAITALERAIQIFGSYRPGGKEQIATYALLSEFHNRCHQYDHCHTTLKELLFAYNNNNHNNNKNDIRDDTTTMNDIVQIAMAKVLWYQGKHAEGKEICDSLVDVVDRSTVSVIARTGQAVTRLLLVSSLDDVFSVRDPFRMSIKRLERMVHPSSTVLAAAHLNMGIVEMVWAEVVSKYNDVDAPLDAAMRNWKQGITILTKGELTSQLNSNTKSKINKDSQLRSILHARLLCNMAYGMLHMNHHADYITRSLEYASESLKIYDAMNNNNNNNNNTNTNNNETTGGTISSGLIDKEGLGRTLSVLGTCYHLNGKAIMAQGLFQSALDKIPVNFTTLSTDATPLQLVEQSDTYDRYADLCSDWEERESEAIQLRQKADDIHAKLLPDGWKDKTSIHGSLWFWTGATIQRH